MVTLIPTNNLITRIIITRNHTLRHHIQILIRLRDPRRGPLQILRTDPRHNRLQLRRADPRPDLRRIRHRCPLFIQPFTLRIIRRFPRLSFLLLTPRIVSHQQIQLNRPASPRQPTQVHTQVHNPRRYPPSARIPRGLNPLRSPRTIPRSPRNRPKFLPSLTNRPKIPRSLTNHRRTPHSLTNRPKILPSLTNHRRTPRSLTNRPLELLLQLPTSSVILLTKTFCQWLVE